MNKEYLAYQKPLQEELEKSRNGILKEVCCG